LCGPGEMQLPEVVALKLPPGVVLSGVSRECVQLLRTACPDAAAVHTTPGFAHPGVFQWRERVGPIRRAGFVGLPTAQNMQVSGPAKRPEMFKEICTRAGVEAVFSEHKYRFEDMQQFYDSVDVVISTSTQEGGPFSPVEAIACGVPALSTDVGLIRDMALPGRFFTAREAAELVPAARMLLPEQRTVTTRHMMGAISAWDRFLEGAAVIRAAHR
jgi:glycosyltransferase involved in cell wall biosynthesis